MERLDWNDLKFLLAAHRKGTLASAAKSLGVTKATVSRRLAALEEAAAARLFDRKPTGLSLTPAGLALVAAAEETERALESVEARVASANDAKPTGTVRLTAPPWIAARCIIPFLPELAALPCLLGDAQASLVRVESLGFATCDMFLVTPEHLRKTPRVRVVAEYVAALVERQRAEIEGRRSA